MASTEQVLLRVGLDASGIDAGTRKLLNSQKDAADKLKSVWKEVGNFIGGSALLGALNNVINKFDDLQDRADNLGVGTDFLQGMGGVASKNAVGGIQSFNKAITDLSSKLGEAKDGGEKAIETFAKYGITLSDIKRLNTEEMFYLIADRIQSIPDPAKRTAAAFDLLGKAGKSMTGVLSSGSAELKKMSDAVDKLDAKKVKELADAKDRIEDTKNTAMVWTGKALGFVGDYYAWLGRIAAQNENLIRNGKLLNDVASDELVIAKKKSAEQKALLDAKKEELAAAKQIAEEAKKTSIQKLTTERTDILKTLRAGEKYASPEEIAGREAMARLKAQYGEGGAMDLGAGKSRLARVAAEYERLSMDEKYSRGMGWTVRANQDRMQADKMKAILESAGAMPKSERISDVVEKLVGVNEKLANLGVTIKGVE